MCSILFSFDNFTHPQLVMFRLFGLLLLISTPVGAQIVNIEEMRITGTNDSLRWYGSIQGAFQWTRIENNTITLRADARTQYKHRRHLVLFLLNSQLLRAGNKDFVRASFGHLRYNYKLKPTTSWEIYAQQQTNKIQKIRGRTLMGMGIRQRFYLQKERNSRLYLGAAYLFENNSYTETAEDRHFHRLSTYATFTLHHPETGGRLQGTCYWQPAIGWVRQARVSTEWLLELPITRRLRLTLDFSWSKDNALPDGTSRESLLFLHGLAWRW